MMQITLIILLLFGVQNIYGNSETMWNMILLFLDPDNRMLHVIHNLTISSICFMPVFMVEKCTIIHVTASNLRCECGTGEWK